MELLLSIAIFHKIQNIKLLCCGSTKTSNEKPAGHNKLLLAFCHATPRRLKALFKFRANNLNFMVEHGVYGLCVLCCVWLLGGFRGLEICSVVCEICICLWLWYVVWHKSPLPSHSSFDAEDNDKRQVLLYIVDGYQLLTLAP